MTAARKLDEPIPYALGPRALDAPDASRTLPGVAAKKSGKARTQMPRGAAPTGTDVPELEQLARQIQAAVTSLRAFVDPMPNARRHLARLHHVDVNDGAAVDNLVRVEQCRLADRARAMVRAWRAVADDGTAPRMFFVEGVFFFARLEAADRKARPDVAEADANARVEARAQALIQRIVDLYPTVGRAMDRDRVAHAIRCGARNGKWKAIHAAWPGSPSAHPSVDGWRAEWSRWSQGVRLRDGESPANRRAKT